MLAQGNGKAPTRLFGVSGLVHIQELGGNLDGYAATVTEGIKLSKGRLNGYDPITSLIHILSQQELVYSQNCSETTFSVNPVNTTALRVDWTNLTEGFQLINLTLGDVTISSNESSGDVIFNGLEHGATYNVSISVGNANCSFEAVQGTTNPSPVTSLSLAYRTTERLAVNWTVPPDTRVSEYTYRITVTNGTGTEAYSTEQGQHEFEVTGLQPGIRYNLTVNSVTPEQTQSAPEAVQGTTNPSPVTNLSLVNRTTESLTINWTLPVDTRASVYRYNITVTSSTGDGPTGSDLTGPEESVFQVRGLQPGVGYNLTVNSVTPENTLSDPEMVKGTTNPSPVTGLSLVNRTARSLVLKWTVPNNTRVAEYTYNITVTSDTGPFTATYTTQRAADQFQVLDLQPGVEYSLTVESVSPENTSSAPENLNGTTNPSPVTNLTVLNSTTESLVINWTVSTDARVSAYRYAVTVTSDTGDFNVTNITRKGEDVFEVTGLKPGVKYNVTVKSGTPEETWSDPETVIGTTNPSLVTNLTVLNTTTESLVIKWTVPTDARVSEYTYTIIVTSKTGDFCTTNITRKGEDVFEVTGLKPGVKYNVTVKSVTPEKILSDPETVKGTTNPSLVTGLSVQNRTTESLVIGWKEPHDIRVSEYRYDITVTSDTGASMRSNSTRRGETEFQVTGLKPGVKYNLMVKSVTPENTTSDPKNVKGTTNPSPVTSLSVFDRTTEILTLQWNAPHDTRALNYTYRVRVESFNFTATHTTSPGMTILQVGPLVPGVQYQLWVESLTPEKTNSKAVDLRAATIPGAISDLHCHEAAGYMITVKWTKPMGNFTGFNFSSYDGELLLTAQNISKDQDALTIQSLQPARTYTIQINTQTGKDYSKMVDVQCQTSSSPIIIGAVIGSLLGLVLIGLLLFCIVTRRLPWRKQPDSDFSQMSPILREVKSVPVSEYESYFRSRHADTDFGFAEEYQSLSMVGTDQSVNAALLMDNKGKNRYTNVLPYDASRVKLISEPDSSTSDYINANYMPGYKSKKEFIAAQGPLPSTVADFWRMIWEQRSEVIVMLTNCVELNRVKCEHYWPLDYTPCTYEDITVTVTSETILSEWTLRDFSIKKAGSSEKRSVKHFHFTAWPDHGVPQTTEKLLAFHKLIREHLNGTQQGSPVIHCR
ncbi:receptor-type tyrosine-protein phosphatase H-like [Scyliorhinus canicula]|uniref:receptor-type tyrosine-protein phosphatase H-like n=1 Tax=Scyliorhinus canicula TaxID=7830 RepID=UPI0018F3C934|nr:receptor-type tyrosine-protein phosphatase H-like [Scyliorhinus canicula]